MENNEYLENLVKEVKKALYESTELKFNINQKFEGEIGKQILKLEIESLIRAD